MPPWYLDEKGASSFFAPLTLNCKFISSSRIRPGENDICILKWWAEGSFWTKPWTRFTAALKIPPWMMSSWISSGLWFIIISEISSYSLSNVWRTSEFNDYSSLLMRVFPAISGFFRRLTPLSNSSTLSSTYIDCVCPKESTMNSK